MYPDIGDFDSILLLSQNEIENGNWTNIPDNFSGGNKTTKKTKKSSQKSKYTKSKRTYKTKDGVERVIYTKGKKTYIKKKNSDGKFVYRLVKIGSFNN